MGDTAPETERQVRALGVSEFIVKGSSMKLLMDTLKSILTPSTLVMGGSIMIETLAVLNGNDQSLERPIPHV